LSHDWYKISAKIWNCGFYYYRWIDGDCDHNYDGINFYIDWCVLRDRLLRGLYQWKQYRMSNQRWDMVCRRNMRDLHSHCLW